MYWPTKQSTAPKHLKIGLIVDVLCLQVAWFTAALLQDQSTPWLLLILLIRVLALKNLQVEVKAAMLMAAIGLLVECLMIVSGLVSYNTTLFMPIWLPILWVIFGFTMAHSMKLMRSFRLPLRALIGAVAGCSTYQAAASFGVLQLQPDRLSASIALLLIWAIVLPLLAGKKTSRTAEINC